ncbi:MAG: hypothetical protein MI757_08440, partial [Pirellulales bacterium]|nr:hypothetical protein [Pirellulales bacterium]
MTLTGEWTSYRRLRAPQEDGAHLVEPSLADIDAVVAENRRRLAADYDVQGMSLVALRDQARSDLIAAATRYVRDYTDVSESDLSTDAPIILTGHQPQLFHPGVWFKNFLADQIARTQDGIALHVIIDADLFGASSIRVPCGTTEAPRWENVEFDVATDRMPAEERTLVDGERFASFGNRVAKAIAPFVEHPLIAEFWPEVLERSRATRNLGLCFAQARHLVEREWNARTLEIPQSRVCQFDAFRWLTANVLAQLPPFWRVHNEALHRYRNTHRIRTTAQPLPDLRYEDD